MQKLATSIGAPYGLKTIDRNYLIKRHSRKVKLSYKGKE